MAVCNSFLDGGAGQWEAMIPRPLAANSTAYLNNWVETITAKYPMSTFTKQLALTDVFDWLGETYYHATTFAYVSDLRLSAAQRPAPGGC